MPRRWGCTAMRFARRVDDRDKVALLQLRHGLSAFLAFRAFGITSLLEARCTAKAEPILQRDRRSKRGINIRETGLVSASQPTARL